MAKEALAINGIPINPTGTNDNSPLNADADWYLTRGLFAVSDNSLQRCKGKLLYTKFDSPVLGIHGDIKDRIFIETAKAIFMLDKIGESIGQFVTGDDDAIVTGDDGGPVTV